MSKKIEQLILTISHESGLADLIESGVTSEEIKGLVVALLSPYFQGKNVLVEMSIDLLLPEAINLVGPCAS